ncbi:DUF3600 domain-containing protein [Aneurinibacillus tyrosinisolvens]|uniref:DUF3600 domain-containing protein n=1 Tax=Aneurinibacillus tyrosinisolvens TaxID=1443435 RepID=UPI00063F21E8|nr:DUF3600 domain-containing protein [Aneurinibacillus tyrosinisolvens]
MNFEDQVRSVLKVKSEEIEHPPALKEKILAQIDFEKKEKSMKKKWIAGIVAAAVMVPTAGFAGYSYLAEQIVGSKEQMIKAGGTETDYNGLERKLQQAKKVLDEKEYNEMAALLKEAAQYSVKVTDKNGTTHPEKLSPAERQQLAEIEKQLAPYSKKMAGDVESHIKELSISESQKLLSFTIKHPSYVPEGYKLEGEVGATWDDVKTPLKPAINMHYAKGNETMVVIQNELEDEGSFHMPQTFDRTANYTLDGYQAFYGEGGQRAYKGLSIIVPKKGEQSAYTIYVSGILEKKELEKIALSVLK